MFPGDHALKLENFIHMLILSSYKEGDYFGWLRKVALFIRLRPSIRYQMWGGATIVLKKHHSVTYVWAHKKIEHCTYL